MIHNARSITVHMLVKNEDQWVWYALQSILPYADRILVTDTGSTDHTLRIIEGIASPKIELREVRIHTAAEVTRERSRQLERTKTDWIWIVDGDEIYPERTAKECLSALASDKYEGIVVRRYDLVGDIYHRQRETVGSYELLGQSGHLVTRFVNQRKIAGLHYEGDYPLEGWYDGRGTSTQDRDVKDWYITKNYLYHAMYLKRSSQGSMLRDMLNRSKYKIETGFRISAAVPEVFALPRPPYVRDVRAPRSLGYELAAGIVTPIKNLKRRFL